MPPCQQVVEEGIAGKDAVLIVLQCRGCWLRRLPMRFSLARISLASPSRGSTRIASLRDSRRSSTLRVTSRHAGARRPRVIDNLPAASQDTPQDAQACRSCAPAWLTDYESLIPSKESRTNPTMDRDHVGARTAVVALGLVVERNRVAAPGILAFEHIPVVRHHRGRDDGALGHAGRNQHRAGAEPAPHALSPAARPLP